MATIHTAQQLHNKLVNIDLLIGKTGVISFNLNNHRIDIASKDIVGNVIQDWIKEWMTKEGVHYFLNTHSQKFPDIYLTQVGAITGLLEIKSFNYKKSPNFDIANFDSYCSSLESNSYRLDSDYLI